MQSQTESRAAPAECESGPDARVSLLAQVDFKWLMAGQGWWIDTARLRGDPSYAGDLIREALASQSLALRECAAWLQSLLGGAAPSNGGGLAPAELLFMSPVADIGGRAQP